MSESISTTLIYCNRGQAAVKSGNTGQFVNSIAHGVKVEKGDMVSVEGIGVGTQGSGSEVIEIPEKIANYNYLTNKMQIETLLYINHNAIYDVMLPLQKGSGTGSGFSFFNSASELASGNGRYGYSTSQGYDLQNNGKYLPTDAKQPYSLKYSGKPLYLGSFADNPRTGKYSNIGDDEALYPSNNVFNLFNKKIILEVETGYNSPANLSKTLTQSLHQNNVTPNYTTLNGVNQLQPQSDTPYNYEGGSGIENEFAVTGEDGVTEIVWAVPRTFTNSQGIKYASPYTSTLASTNPYYHYWGSRLLCRGLNPQGTTKHNQYLNEKYSPKTGRDFEIYSLTTRVFNVNPTQAGFTIVTNLPYDTNTLIKLQGFLHSQKELDPVGDTLATNDLFKKENQKRFFTDLRFGRNDDSQGENVQLANNLIGTSSTQFLKLKTRSFYEESYVGNAFVNSETTGCSVDKTQAVTIKGKVYDYKEAAQYFNMNVVPVKTQYTPTSPIQINIGIVIDTGTIMIFPLEAGSNFLVDFSLYNRTASLSLLSSTDLIPKGSASHIDDLIPQIFIGSPEITLTFDEEAARFKFQRLYWSNYITNDVTGDDANASAGTEVITLNPSSNIFYSPDKLLYRYAQAGIGITDLSVFDLDGNAQLIDWYDDNDINDKFTQSLLWRLGFRYKNFINKYGMPLALQVEKYYNTAIPTINVNKFSYPLTSNPRFDTTLLPSVSTYDNGLPAWRLGISRGQPDINIASEPNDILASALPKKLATPMWLIESDIIEGINYTIDGIPKNVIAVVNRAYSNSDFVFSFATDYKFTATNSFVITHIKSNILTSDLINADVDDETSIIYKVEHVNKLGENTAVIDNGIPYEPIV